jgi:hypothetical protein
LKRSFLFAVVSAAVVLLGCDHVDRVCEINQGWPCTCDQLGAQCKDGTICVNIASSFPASAPSAQAGERGYCAAPCENPEVDVCPETDWGLNTVCWTETFTDDIYLCILYCESDGDCPRGQECTEGLYCHPINE